MFCLQARLAKSQLLISCSVDHLHFGGNKAPRQEAPRLRGRREERRLQGIREL
ncbi:MAG: hypothetical protein F6K47_34480 [Symploca sp. SIO2E6]|nr:hypothetical protein [Symploca sp. SIO2E6]